MFKRVPGTKDVLPEEVSRWQKIEELSRNLFSIYNYREIRPPLIEDASLFNRSLGESAEIVQKQMFLLKHQEDLYALRPEGTASIVRAYIENNLDKAVGFIKLYYIGPMFRLERPQKGRLRQFNHLGYEAIGSVDASLDVEVISLADKLLQGFSIEGYKIKINTLGCAKDKKKLSAQLHKALKENLPQLCAECRRRFDIIKPCSAKGAVSGSPVDAKSDSGCSIGDAGLNNVLRILDCKNEACRGLVKKLNLHGNSLCPECEEHFERVKAGLDGLKINYEITPYLVRGLDYYTRTVFEISHDALGAQDAIGAGGRYDNLVKELGGPDVGAIGFAFGIERLLLVHGLQFIVQSKNLVYIVTLGDEAKKEGIKLLDNLRKNGIVADTDYENKSLKGAMRRANDLGARYAVIIGEDELKKNAVTLKDMVTGEQREIEVENLITELKKNYELKS